MKKILIVIAILCVAFTTLTASPKHEFRATWFTTVANIDWPKTKVTSDATRELQKKELTDRLDALAANNINAVFFQVRGRSDAFYNSNYEPWAAELTGTLGNNPDYDPLAFAIEEAHKRGMELHAWINPFRIATAESNQMTEDEVNTLYKAPDSKEKLMWDWVLSYYTKTKKQDRDSLVNQIVDPGNPYAREYVVNVMMDIVTNYDVDGVVMDDYFYAYAGTTNQDQTSQDAYYDANKVVDVDGDGDKLDDWRRSNVDAVIYDFSTKVRAAKPWVRFGMGPGGIWTMKSKAAEAYGIRLPNNIVGADLYELLGCNTVEWIKNGWVDYVCPQIYWATTAAQQDYDVLCKWWAKDVCEHFSNLLSGEQRVHFYPSHAGYKVYETYKEGIQRRYEGFGDNEEEGKQEMINQIESNRQNLSSGYTGSVYFSNKDFVKMSSEIKAACYQYKSLVPPMAWKSTETLDAPNTLRISGKTLTWTHTSADRFTVYIYPKNVHVSRALEDPYYFQGVVYGNSFTLPNTFDATTQNVAVCAYDRYGVEHAAAEYGPDVTYVLNGGVVEYEKQITVPKNEELWASFKTAAGITSLGTLEEIKAAGAGKPHNDANNPCACRKIAGQLNNAKMRSVFENTEWKWLYDYIRTIQTTLATDLSVDDNVSAWRYAIAAFFLQSEHTVWPATANFSTAGQPSAWGPAYLAAHSNTNVEPQPTNAELWTSFKPYYNTYYGLSRADQTIENVASFAATYMQDIMTNANSEYKWLGDYISSVVSAQGKAALSNESAWRWAVHAFFNCYDGTVQGTQLVATANFSTAGQPAAWKAAWDAAHTTSADPETSTYTLPDFIETALTLPTEDSRPVYITHPNEYTFAGWIDQTGASITELSVGYKGILYAQWQGDIKWVLNGGIFTGHDHLPMSVTQTYTLPTARNMSKEGYKFVGWYDNQACTGDAIATIPANYTGTLYAKWEEGTPVTWHPGAEMDITNEDLWELFVVDYNTFYTSDILGENKSTKERAYQVVTGAFGFMASGEDKFKTGGRAKDFMEHPQSPWKWLGDYIIETLDEENKKLESNAPLWTSFKEATGLTHLGVLKDITVAQICSKNALYSNSTDDGKTISSINDDGSSDASILTALFAKAEWQWLKKYIKDNTTTVLDDNIEASYSNRRAWAFAVALFFKQESRTSWPVWADFTTAGKHSVWKDVIPEEYHELGHFRITSDLEWRKTLHAFFNHTNTLTYTVNSTTKTEGTADFTLKGLPRPITNPDAGWYNDWWNGNFPAYMIDAEPLPYLQRTGYVFGGWYYGNENGYVFNNDKKATSTYNANMQAEYRNHLWARWLELCLYDGYVNPDPFAMDEQGNRYDEPVNHNFELVECAAAETKMNGQPHKIDVVHSLVGGMYNTMFLPFGINGVGGKIDGVETPGKQYYLRQVVDDDGNQLLPPETTSILVYDSCTIDNQGGEQVLVFNFHEFAEANPNETLLAKQPFLIMPAQDVNVRMHFWKANMADPFNPNQRPDFSGSAKFQGIYEPTVVGDIPEQETHLMLVANNRLAQVSTPGEMLGLRAYFRVPKDTPQGIKSVIRVQNGPTGTEQITTTEPTARKILHNGQIYIIRDGKMYDLMGRSRSEQ